MEPRFVSGGKNKDTHRVAGLLMEVLLDETVFA